jgi:3-oxoacyl-[acyl-carrier protein] reductase
MVCYGSRFGNFLRHFCGDIGGFSMQLGVQDKVFMIAGGSRGLGFGIASALARESATIAIGNRDLAAGEVAAEHLRECYGAKAVAHACDMTDAAAITRWVEHVTAEFGRIDGLVVNAGGPKPGAFDTLADSDWEEAFQLTLMSAVRLIRAVLPALRVQGGSILVLTSSSVQEPDNYLLLSAVMRAGVANLVKGISFDLARENIRINCLVPGIVKTDRIDAIAKNQAAMNQRSVDDQLALMQQPIPLGRFGTVDEFGNAGAFLLSEAASYITGATLVIDGGKMRAM